MNMQKVQKQVEIFAQFDDLESSKGIKSIRFQADNCSFLAQKATITFQLIAVVDSDEQPFLQGQEVSTQQVFELEGEEFADFWADDTKELYQMALLSLSVEPTSIDMNVTTYDHLNPQNSGTVTTRIFGTVNS